MVGAHRLDYVLRCLAEEGEKVSFTQDFAAVIVGSCATGMANMVEAEIGASTVKEGGSTKMSQRFWDHHLEGVEGTVLVVTECCGQYSKNQLDELRERFPKITFVAPRIEDYCDKFHWDRERKDLLRADLIKVD